MTKSSLDLHLEDQARMYRALDGGPKEQSPSRTLEPMTDRIIVTRREAAATTEGGLIIPEAAQEKPQEAVVKSVGPGAYNAQGYLIPMQVRAGDVVLIGRYAGTEMTVDGQPVLIIRQDDILAKVHEVGSKGR